MLLSSVQVVLLVELQDVLPPDLPLISVSKGLEVSTGQMMSEIIPSALQRKQPAVFLSGPSFAREVMELCPTVVVAASKASSEHQCMFYCVQSMCKAPAIFIVMLLRPACQLTSRVLGGSG